MRAIGAKVEENVDIIDTYIDMVTPFLLTIGNNVAITNCRVLTNDVSTKNLKHTKTEYVIINDKVFIGAYAIVYQNTNVGSNVIIGDVTMVDSDVSDHPVVIGNLCRIICSYL